MAAFLNPPKGKRVIEKRTLGYTADTSAKLFAQVETCSKSTLRLIIAEGVELVYTSRYATVEAAFGKAEDYVRQQYPERQNVRHPQLAGG
jgi:hypothetical protein